MTIIAVFKFQRPFFQLIFFFFLDAEVPLGKCLTLQCAGDNGEVVPPPIKMNIYQMQCVNNPLRAQEGSKEGADKVDRLLFVTFMIL